MLNCIRPNVGRTAQEPAARQLRPLRPCVGTGTSLCTIALKTSSGIKGEIQAILENDGSAGISARGQNAFVAVDPRSITLHTDTPEGSASNVIAGQVIQILYLGGQNGQSAGRVRISLSHIYSTIPLVAEITENSLERLDIIEGRTVYASFKAVEALAYL